VIRLGIRKFVEEALEAEVRDALGREYYERGSEPGRGYRNGTRIGRLETAEGAVEYGAPQVCDRDKPFHSKVREQLSGRTDELERLVVEMYARGLSTRDIEEALRDEGTGRLLVSRTAVSEITERLWAEYEAFATRDLSEFPVVYLFVDGIAERLRPGQPREAVLCAWGICGDGRKVLLHLSPGTKEDTASCKAFFQDLKRRGLVDPLLIVTDGAPGLIRAVEECFPRSERGRCLAHRMRNLQSKVPEADWPEFRTHVRACYEAPSLELARALREDVVKRFRDRLPAAMACFEDDFEACIAHLRFPIAHRKFIRTTNLLERLFVEERRRSKIIPNFFHGERPVLKLMYAALIRASERWRGVRFTPFESRQLDAIRAELDGVHAKRTAPAIRSSEAKSPSSISSKVRT
jgi:transposase-like protein